MSYRGLGSSIAGFTRVELKEELGPDQLSGYSWVIK